MSNYIKVLSAKPGGKIRRTNAKKIVRRDPWEVLKDQVRAIAKQNQMQTT